MLCPNCAERALEPHFTKQGVVIDRCEKCGGVWLDRGELLLFTRDAKAVAERLDGAAKRPSPTAKLSPVSLKEMTEIVYPGGAWIDLCAQSGGLWFDKGELDALLMGPFRSTRPVWGSLWAL